jgi:glycosyltransferase involved in cell wall biosynthesis
MVTLLVNKHFDLIEGSEFLNIKRINFPMQNPISRAFWEMLILPFFLRKNHVDVFFCPGGIIPRFGFGKWKTVTMFRNMMPFDLELRKKYPLGYFRLRNWLLSKIMLRSMESADLVIFISKYAKKFIEDLSKNGIKNSVTIPHGVSDDFRIARKVLQKRPSYFPQDKYLVYPSIIDVYKSQKELVRGVAILKKKKVSMPVVLLVGEVYGDYGKELKLLIKDLELEREIIIFEPIKHIDMPLLYHYAEFVIFASKSENCPNILLEALASSCAVVCSNKMPMPEFASEAVEYFNPDDPISIANKIQLLLDDSNTIVNLEKKATVQSELFNWPESAKKTWEALDYV